MRNNQFTILVTGIGGNVAQGILRNIRNDFPEFYLVGTGIENLSGGNHLCDSVRTLPYAYHIEYIPLLLEIVKEYNVDLIIPSTDFEVYYLSLNINKFPCKIAVSGVKSSEVYLDKYLTSLHHNKYDIPFVKTVLPSQYKRKDFNSIIAKPRKGRGSRGLIFDASQISSLHDNEYIVQEKISGTEITTAFYVNLKKELHGQITLVRTLISGTTNTCYVEDRYDEKLKNILLKIIENSDIMGSANLQSIVNEKGEIFPFEINCRISGTNSIRSQFGFNDVRYTIQELLTNQSIEKVKIKKGVATRILMDVIYLNTIYSDNFVSSTPNYLY